MSANERTLINKVNNVIKSIKNNFNNFKEDEPISVSNMNASSSFIEIRTNMLNWLSFLCETLKFNIQTFFRSITIFDLYMTKLISKTEIDIDQKELNLITVACLSLSTKMEEINCNYISFLNEKVLNKPNEKIYTNKDLTKMEFTILKELHYKLIYSTPFDFLELYIEVFRNLFGNISENFYENLRKISINLMKNNITNEMFLNNNYSKYAHICFINALSCLNILEPIIILRAQKIIFGFNYQYYNKNEK